MNGVLSSLLALIFLSAKAELNRPQDNFELNDEKLGETLSSFQSLHPKARCVNPSRT
jgi:hypothetical protein